MQKIVPGQINSVWLVLVAVVLAAVNVSHDAPVIAAEPQYLPGELPVTLGRELVGVDRIPTLLEIEHAVNQPDVASLLVFRLLQGSDNHYAPAWSGNGQSLVCLRADLDQRTSKLSVFRQLHDLQPETIYDDSLTYEHMPAWGPGTRLAFASNRGDDREEHIHLWQTNSPARALTTGPGLKTLPQLQHANDGARLLFRRTDQFELLTWPWQEPDRQLSRELGPADEMRLSPDGQRLAVIRTPGRLGSGQELAVRQLSTQRDSRLAVPAGYLFRNAVWSPDGRWLAFWARPQASFDWELWTAAESGSSPPAQLRAGVRVQEDFRHVTPAWSPDSMRIWFILSRGEQSYYPLQWVSPDGLQQGLVNYSKGLTTALDVAACPDPAAPSLSFVAVSRRSLEVYVMLLNHL
jgi:hypothetical protein